MALLPVFLLALGAFGVLAIMVFVFAGPSASKAQSRRLSELRGRHVEAAAAQSQARRIATNIARSKSDLAFARLLPDPAQFAKRLAMTGKDWTVGQYGLTCLGLTVTFGFMFWLKGLPFLLALFLGIAIGLGVPHFAVNVLIKRRLGKFTAKFPDAIELLVRGLRSGLPISETIGVVGNELDGPVGIEFRMVSDKMKIGRTMDSALQDTADRLGTPEFQFFVITIAIQRETGGNLAETLSNLATVLRQRAQMKLKIRAMSSESKASAYIVGSLPFIVFGMIWMINSSYMQGFFTDQRLMVAGLGGLVWMSIGAFIMAKMVNFEI